MSSYCAAETTAPPENFNIFLLLDQVCPRFPETGNLFFLLEIVFFFESTFLSRNASLSRTHDVKEVEAEEEPPREVEVVEPGPHGVAAVAAVAVAVAAAVAAADEIRSSVLAAVLTETVAVRLTCVVLEEHRLQWGESAATERPVPRIPRLVPSSSSPPLLVDGISL